MILLAHIGHWWGYLLYAVPLIIVLISIVNSRRRDRRGDSDSNDPG
jgi:hypothetical protein